MTSKVSMLTPFPKVDVSKSAAEAARKALLTLRMACTSLPHLSGVASVIRIVPDSRIAYGRHHRRWKAAGQSAMV